MKKLILTILFTLVLSGSAFAQCIEGNCLNGNGVKIYSNGSKYIGNFKNGKYEGAGILYRSLRSETSNWKNGKLNGYTVLEEQTQNGKQVTMGNYEEGLKNGRIETTFPNGSIVISEWKKGKLLKSEYASEKDKELVEMSFTIGEKKQQCKTIGFKPETEKFADCVLRLVELDVEKQKQNKIIIAESNGNLELAKQLKRQNNLQSSEALINLGQQLMNPKRYNSNIYMPQTKSCRISGYGNFARVTCY